jgi:hypothetical protein
MQLLYIGVATRAQKFALGLDDLQALVELR